MSCAFTFSSSWGVRAGKQLQKCLSSSVMAAWCRNSMDCCSGEREPPSPWTHPLDVISWPPGTRLAIADWATRGSTVCVYSTVWNIQFHDIVDYRRRGKILIHKDKIITMETDIVIMLFHQLNWLPSGARDWLNNHTLGVNFSLPVAECPKPPSVEPVSRCWHQVALSLGCAGRGPAWAMRWNPMKKSKKWRKDYNFLTLPPSSSLQSLSPLLKICAYCVCRSSRIIFV